MTEEKKISNNNDEKTIMVLGLGMLLPSLLGMIMINTGKIEDLNNIFWVTSTLIIIGEVCLLYSIKKTVVKNQKNKGITV